MYRNHLYFYTLTMKIISFTIASKRIEDLGTDFLKDYSLGWGLPGGLVVKNIHKRHKR